MSCSWSCASSASGAESALLARMETPWERRGSLGSAASSALLSSDGQERLIKGSGPSAHHSTTRLPYFTLHSAALDEVPSLRSTDRQDLQLLNVSYDPQIQFKSSGDGEIMI